MADSTQTRSVTRPKMVQVEKDELDNLLLQYQQTVSKNKKMETQLKAFTNLTEIINRQEQALKVNKKKAQQFESAYIVSESKLGQCLQLLIHTNKEGRPPDIEVIENLLRLKTDDLWSNMFSDEHKSSEDKYDNSNLPVVSEKTVGNSSQDNTKRSNLEEDCDNLEEDCASDITKYNPAISQNSNSGKQEALDGKKGVTSQSKNMSPGVKTATLSLSDVQKELFVGKDTEKVTDITEDDLSAGKPKQIKTNLGNVTTKSQKVEFDSVFSTSQGKEIIEKVLADNRRFREIFQEYETLQTEGWNAFLDCKRYEDLIKNLRLEVANERIHSSQLQMLLAAKQGENVDALTKKITDLDKQVVKLHKQLTAKNALLHSLNKEYNKVKADCIKLTQNPKKVQLSFETMKQEADNKDTCTKGITSDKHKNTTQNSINDNFLNIESSLEKQSETKTEEILDQSHYNKEISRWKERYQSLEQKIKDMVSNNKKEELELKNLIEKLKDENKKLSEEFKNYSSVVEEMQTQRLSIADDDHITISWTQLKEDNERLQGQITAYKHELEAKKNDDKIVEAQLKIYQEDYQNELSDRKKEQELFEKEKQQRLKLIKSLADKSTMAQEQYKRVESEKKKLQDQFNTLHNMFEKEFQKNMSLQQPSNIMRTGGIPHSRKFEPMSRMQDIAATGNIQTDGVDMQDPLPQNTPSGSNNSIRVGYKDMSLDNTKKEQVQSAPVTTRSAEPIDSRVITGSDSNIRIPKELPKVLECPQCYREFNPRDIEKYKDHCKKCMMS